MCARSEQFRLVKKVHLFSFPKVLVMGNTNSNAVHGYDPSKSPADLTKWEQENNQNAPKPNSYAVRINAACLVAKATDKLVMTYEEAVAKWHQMDVDAQKSVLGKTYNEYIAWFQEQIESYGDMLVHQDTSIPTAPDLRPPSYIEYLPLSFWNTLITPYFKDRYQHMKDEIQGRLNTLNAIKPLYDLGKGVEDLAGGAFDFVKFLSKYGVYILAGGAGLFVYSSLKK